MNNEHPPVKILLVDDNAANLLALEALLSNLEATFVKVTSGKEALKCLLDQEFALILLDVKMPEMDGLETASIIRTREKNKDTPIIFITAYHPNETNIFQGYAVGAVDYIIKPIVPEILLSKVKIFIQLFQQNNTLKKLNQELINVNREFKRSNQELEQFAYVASHDLQEPLRAITSYTQLLAKRYQGNLDQKADKYIGYIVDGATRMQQLIEDLLTYSRAGRNELILKPTDCNLIMNRVVRDLKIAIAETSGNVTWDILPTITADSAQMTQLLENIVGNALKYYALKPPEIHIGATRQDNEWLFSIRDNGIGIDSQYADRIFVIFQRLHTRQEYPGTGIGLALCKKIVERHHGRIWMDSELGKGTTFYFTMPI